ncbi:DUF2997 domain-containing protein [Anthocerotibacter panamensis]|uniref:DUF2997 domain-containing protein n=1 Tax=Anthocerotibacter panamensis TaxID=2857077 RepID=UPI001C402644
MQEIEFILYPDGRVEERVSGVCGTDCMALTQAIEEKLGAVRSNDLTQDYYQQATVTQTLSSWS